MATPEEAPELVDKVVHINRCAKVVKGGSLGMDRARLRVGQGEPICSGL